MFRFDNGLDYCSSIVNEFCVSYGIIHQTSCVVTPQQNGVIERKNKHLLDVACTIKFHMKIPSRFWGEAVLIACYLINHLPSSFLKFKTPYSTLYLDREFF